MFGRVCPDELMPEKKQDALNIITLIKDKRCGKIKGRAYVDDRVQRSYITKEEAAAPTVSMETLLSQLMIDTLEEHTMAIFEVPGAYLNFDIPEDKFVLLKLEDYFVYIM